MALDRNEATGALRWLLLRLAILAAVTGLYTSGALDALENQWSDARQHMSERAATDDIVVVAIDPPSLKRIGVWPWPREFHARLLDRLIAAGAAAVAFDIDFSARTTEAGDRAFEAALRRAGGRAVLAAFRQRASAEPNAGFVMSEPLPRFQQFASIASTNVRPDPDGRVRRFATADTGLARSLPAMATILADPALASPVRTFHIDYRLRPDTVPTISYADLLDGHFDPAMIAGRRVIVGATAIELGDIVSVPVWTTLPGVLVEATAARACCSTGCLSSFPGR